MKEIYAAPTAELIRFQPEERLASSVDFSDLVANKPASVEDGDINIEF
jgi:hypothetical protein